MQIKNPYKRGRNQKRLVVIFPKVKFDIFIELATHHAKYSELVDKHKISKHVARDLAGKTIYWLRRIAEEARDEELETITLRRQTYERDLSIRQYLEKYGEFFVTKIKYYQHIGVIEVSEEIDGTRSEWRE